MIEVVAPGLFTTVQDLGRYGYGPLGVSPAGAADTLALRIGNRLVGNADGAAALEMTLLGGTFRFLEPAVYALTGSDFGAPLWEAREVEAGFELKLGPTRSGARCYLCVRGGIEAPVFLGSASTHTPSGIGRPLRQGDLLGRAGGTEVPRGLKPAPPRYRKLLRVTPGPQTDWFRGALGEYTVTEEANRMGLRLAGDSLPAPEGSMTTEGVSVGAIQVPPGGQPIISFVDQQTTGGYPVIANVIAADLPSVGQLRPRDRISFEYVSFADARALLLAQERSL
jgi:biotin-dependent carboxylase-like uncharacterized protein